MWRIIIIILILLTITGISFGQLIDDDVMPFGVFSGHWGHESYFTDSMFTIMENLGFNQHMAGGFTVEACSLFNEHGIYPYAWSTHLAGSGIPEPQSQYSEGTYFVCQPESSSYYNITFRNVNRDSVTSDGVFIVSDKNTVMLDSLSFNLKNYYTWDDQNKINYYPLIRIKIDTTGNDGDTLVGIFRAVDLDADPDDTIYTSSIYFNDFPTYGDSMIVDTAVVLSLISDADTSNFFNAHSSTQKIGRFIHYSFEIFGNCTVYFDYFQLHSEEGLGVINGDYNDLIKLSAGRAEYDGKILGWHLREQSPGTFRTCRYIDSLIADTTATWGEPVRATNWLHSGTCSWGAPGNGYNDFVKIAPPKLFWAYLYPIWLDTDYTGYGANGLQTDFDKELSSHCLKVREAIALDQSVEGWLYTPQYWFCDPEYNDCPGGEQRRMPTQAETRCLTYIGMCYHPISILGWKLDTYSGKNVGIIDVDGSPIESIFNAINDDINPYIKAIDEYYMPLAWIDADYISPGSTIDVDLINNITAVSNDPDSTSPDLGWMHVGVYQDDNDDYYFMLVNRACSSDSIGTEAGSITAKVEINRGLLYNPDSLLVIDIANELEKIDGQWRGIPDTSYCYISNRDYYYETTLRAGEGRLYKIAEIR